MNLILSLSRPEHMEEGEKNYIHPKAVRHVTDLHAKGLNNLGL